MLTLLGTPGCHLCDRAEELLKQAALARPLQWDTLDIVVSDQLIARWGEKIPVLLDTEGRALCWPFSLLDVLRFNEIGA